MKSRTAICSIVMILSTLSLYAQNYNINEDLKSASGFFTSGLESKGTGDELQWTLEYAFDNSDFNSDTALVEGGC